jgi:hypothetical protein
MKGVASDLPTFNASKAKIDFVGAIHEPDTAIKGSLTIRPVFTLANSFDDCALSAATAIRLTVTLRGHTQGDR